jgi:hypothetical protein
MGGEGRGEVGSSHKLLPNLTLNLFLNPSALAKQIKITTKSKIKSRILFACFVCFVVNPLSQAGETCAILKPAAFAHHIEHFNTMEPETIVTHIPNSASWPWLQKNIPLFECPDRDVEEIYYFRWWSFRKHIKRTPQGYVITEFLPPVSHAGEFNTISCATSLHLAEGRWLRDDRYLNDYTKFWLRGDRSKPQPHFHKFSSWFAAAAWDRYLVNADKQFLVKLLPDLVSDYRTWETERQLPSGLFWQYDVRDGMEESISGSRTNKNLRPTINSYMFANAQALANVARLAKKSSLAVEFEAKAATLKRLTEEQLWDNDAKFFKVRLEGGALSDAREAIGFIPWMFDLPDATKGYETAWSQITDPRGFSAPFGLTTAERRHSEFRHRGVGTCEWDGAVWPFATSQTLYALANFLRSDSLSTAAGERAGVRFPRTSSRIGSMNREKTFNTQHSTSNVQGRTFGPSLDVGSSMLNVECSQGFRESGNPAINHQPSTINYFSAFLTYTHSQRANGQPFIGEYLDEVTGDWINGNNDRSRYYNHSTFADLLITGVIGLRPRADDVVEIHPLLPPGTWDWFCLDGVKYHGRMLTVIWDQDGSRYGRGAGLRVLVGGKEIANSATLERITAKLP